MFENPLPGVPAVESPFFDAIFTKGTIDEDTLAIARQLRDKGFAVIDFPEPDFDRIASEIRDDLNDRYDWEHWRTAGYQAGESLRMQDAFKFNDNVRRIATNARVIEILSTIFGRQAWPFQTLNFPVGTQQHFHTDSVHFSSMPQRFMCGVWTAFEDISEDAGPLVYYPGSHHWPIYTNEHIGARAEQKHEIGAGYGALWRELVKQSGIEPERFTPRKGQALIWLSNLLHGGDKQNDPSLTRWSQVTHYFFEGCSYYTPLHSDPFLGNIAFREMTNICTGEIVRNTISGAPVPHRLVHPPAPAPIPSGSLLRRVARRAKAALTR
ncbi:phytanoyl-CoA dioxygenase family protein [Paraburkholderia terrae]|uniref:phytanoyl-CoA dioxygenase family protein n=1 Tax=Paraburkholderia terrae TaxID=311230 RepID=UPI00296AC2C7|nr:phytanoyl-CoA dioxygenase family protein [Paraburkholderia terrae]MDW3660316.1 phytanoyl-CoA dioxygenase family protein [Paraburkholderia terrae]